jgi:hypothetical protein
MCWLIDITMQGGAAERPVLVFEVVTEIWRKR